MPKARPKAYRCIVAACVGDARPNEMCICVCACQHAPCRVAPGRVHETRERGILPLARTHEVVVVVYTETPRARVVRPTDSTHQPGKPIFSVVGTTDGSLAYAKYEVGS